MLDLSTLVQGPQAGAMLHDLGADVIKIELPEVGDVGRHVDVMDVIGHASPFVACNRGKRSVAIDLRVPAGKAAFEKLVETADVVLSNFQPGTLEKWGLAYDDLVKINPRVICAAGSSWARSGPTLTGRGPTWSAKRPAGSSRRLATTAGP